METLSLACRYLPDGCTANPCIVFHQRTGDCVGRLGPISAGVRRSTAGGGSASFKTGEWVSLCVSAHANNFGVRYMDGVLIGAHTHILRIIAILFAIGHFVCRCHQ